MEKNKQKIIKKKDVVINPLNKNELLAFLDDKSKEIIKYFIIKSLFSQPEPRINQKQLPVQVPKEHIEQWFTQALNVKPVGAGSYPIDIYNDRDHWGADIKMLNIKIDKNGNVTNGDSGEASLGQNFSDAGIKLDSLFLSKNHNKIKNNWIKLYKSKYDSLKKTYPIKSIFYFFILRPGVQIKGADFYFCGALLNVDNLDNVIVNKKRTTKSSVFLNNFITDSLGNTKIYKAKKRLELRLKPKNWIENDMAIKISTSYMPSYVDLRSKDVGPKYLEKEIKKIQKIKIDFIA